jgi:hypothetical protein
MYQREEVMDHQAFAQLLGNYGEFFGAIAVVATLVYLAIQIRQNTKVARSATRQAIAEMTINLNSDLVSDQTLGQSFLKDLGNQPVEAGERLRLLGRSYRLMRNWENIHYQHLTGMLSEDEWRGFRLNLKACLQWNIVKEYWQNESQFFSETFRTEVSEIQQELDSESSNLSHAYVLDQPRDDGIH